MKFRLVFSFSKTERELRLRFWDWEIWRLEPDFEEEQDSSKAGYLDSGEEPDKEENFSKLMFQALFYQKTEARIWYLCKRFIDWIFNLFSVEFKDVEIKGSLGDPFYDAIALGMSGGCYYPDWKDESEICSAKGEVLLKIGIFRFLFFVLSLIYEAIVLSWIFWQGTRLAKNNPKGENMDDIRRWIFLKAKDAI